MGKDLDKPLFRKQWSGATRALLLVGSLSPNPSRLAAFGTGCASVNGRFVCDAKKKNAR